MPDEILDRLDALEANLGGRFDHLEAKIDRLQEDFQAHRKLVSENFETVAEALEAIRHGNSGPTRVAR